MEPTKHFLSGQKIIVAGAGVSGLAFAIGLRKQWPRTAGKPPSIKIYDRDVKANAEGREGYSMSLRSDMPGGIQALMKLGLIGEMQDVSVHKQKADGQSGGFCIWDSNWHSVIKVSFKPDPNLPVVGLRIARNKMRAVMIEAATKAGCEIAWDRACTGVRKLEDGKLEVQLGNGEKDICDLLIAADGSKSKLRAQLRPTDTLEFQEVVTIAATSRFDGLPPKPVDTHWGMLINGTGTSLFSSPVDQQSALWSLNWKSTNMREKKKFPLTDDEKAALMAEAREHAPLFPPLFTKLLEHTDQDTLMTLNGLDKKPFAHKDSEWSHVVFIGDANHAITPFAGNGANMALCDGFDLADYLCNSDSVGAAVTRFDTVMVPRSTKVYKQSHFNIGVAHATGWRHWAFMLFMRVVGLVVMRGGKSEPPED